MDDLKLEIVSARQSSDLTPFADLRESMAEYARASRADNTRRAYRTQWDAFVSWCEGRRVESLPASPAVVAAYLTSRAKAGASVASMNVMLAAVGHAHRLAGFPFDRKARELATTWEGIRRKETKPQRQAEPIRAPELGDIIRSAGNTPLDIRDAAMLSLAYVFGLRRSELSALDWHELGNGDGFVRIGATVAELTLARSKGSQAESVTVPVLREGNPVAFAAIERWVDHAKIEPGQPLMRSVNRGGRVGGRLAPDGVGRAIKARMLVYYMGKGAPREKAAEAAKAFTGHSLRVGLAVTAAEAGADVRAIADALHQKSLTMARRYSEKADKLRTSVHRLKGVGV